MRTENQVFADFCDCLDEAKSKMGIDSSWTVLARNPQNMVRTDGIVLVDKISQRRKGFQNEKSELDDEGNLHTVWEWIEEYRFQVSVARERKLDDTTTTVTADEVACQLRAWVNSSVGARYMRTKNMAPLFAFDVVNQNYRDENEVYQYFSHFDVAVQVVQEKDFSESPVDEVMLGIKHVPICNEGESGPVEYETIWKDGSESE